VQDWQITLTDFPRGDYDVRVDCSVPEKFTSTITVPTSSFPPVLDVHTNQTFRLLYCDRASGTTGPATLSLYRTAQGPDDPNKLSLSDTAMSFHLSLQQGDFPPGDYQLTATCASSDTPPFTATPLTLSSGQLPPGPTPTPTATATPTAPATPTPTATPTEPAGKVSAQITGCSAQDTNAYNCELQVQLPALSINTVFSVDVAGAAFANPSGNDRPEVTTSQGCDVPPLPSPYLATGDHYTRYAVNISSGGCQAGAVVTIKEAVAGMPGGTITQTVTVPGLNAATATFQLPAALATSTPTVATATPTPRPSGTAEPTATATPRPTEAVTPATTATGR
jgi:hypothetical protein